MAPLLRINDLDLSSHLRVHHGEGLAPSDPDAVQPQFAGSPAFREGQSHVGEAVGNYEHVYPLLLDAPTRQALNALVAQINRELKRGSRVEYAHDSSVDEISYFDLEAGTLEVEYQYFLASHGVTRATLRLTTRPFAHSGTYRSVIPSAEASSISVRLATGIVGDRAAVTRFFWRAGSQLPSDRQIFAWGVHAEPSARLVATAAQFTFQHGGTVVGASGAVASAYAGVGMPTNVSANDEVVRITTPPPGRSRLYAVLRSGLFPATALRLYAEHGGVVDSYETAGPTVIATQSTSGKWQLADFGEVNIPSSHPSAGVPSYGPDLLVTIRGRVPSGASHITASQALHISGVIFQPLNVSAGVVFNPTAYTPHFKGLRAGDILGAYEHPDLYAYSSRSTVDRVSVNLTANIRGHPPRLPPVGSGGNATPMSVIAFGGDVGDFKPVDNAGWSLDVRERWRFLR